MMKLVIDRSNWLHGEGSENSFLLRGSDGKMCCLGFLACQLGAKEKTITNNSNSSDMKDLIYYNSNPSDMPSLIDWPEWMLTIDNADSKITTLLMSVNDNENYSDGDREQRIDEIFDEQSIEVELSRKYKHI